MPPAVPTHYVILVRHAARERRWNLPEKDHPMLGWQESAAAADRGAASDGLPRTYALAGALADQLDVDGVRVEQIVTSKHRVAVQTAAILAEVLALRFGRVIPSESLAELTPETADPAWLPDTPAPRKDRCIPAVLVVGHQPQLTEVANALVGRPAWQAAILRRTAGHDGAPVRLIRARLRRSVPGGVLPLGNSEVACIMPHQERALLWLLTEKSDDLRNELERKIQSKLDVAKFFLGAMILNFGLYLQSEAWNTLDKTGALLWAAAVVCMLASFVFTIGTLYSYDRLAMPRAFWGSDQGKQRRSSRVSRPPSQDHLVLFYEMMRVWQWLFTPAMVTACLAVGLMVVLFASRALAGEAAGATPTWLVLIAASAALVIPAFFYRRFRPELGLDD